MLVNLKYINLEYTEKDLEYIDYLTANLDSVSEEILKFFNLDKLDNKVEVKLYDSIEEFRKKYEGIGYNLDSNGKTPGWVCGFASNGKVYVLSLEEYRKSESHENDTLDDLLHLILHEFTHAVHYQVDHNLKDACAWLNEGLATTISHQYDGSCLKFEATLEQMINGGTSYLCFHTMFKYVLDTYGKDYIIGLIKDHDLLHSETPNLYEEVKENICKKKY